MLFWFLVLLALVFLPWLLFPVLLFLLLGVVLLPLGFTLRSLVTLIQVPGQLWSIAVNPRLRRNHALEHATINVIEEKLGPQQLAGFAREDGFFLRGNARPELIREAAVAGLNRLKQGEWQLAIHRRCGTSMAAANLLAAVAFVLLLLVTQQLTLVNVLLAVIISSVVGPVLGDRLQTVMTTRTDVAGMQISDVQVRSWAAGRALVAGGQVPAEFFIRTSRAF